MKYIKKAGIPRGYSEWCAEVTGTPEADWRMVPSDEKRQALAGMIAEQGGLCAYTMRRIDEESSHVEHVKPQSRCRQDLSESDLDYGNLVACYPRKASCGYGARRKGAWWEDDGARFVSPLHPACERAFKFRLDGGIEANENRTGAATTIEVLGLDDRSLTEDRGRVIQQFIYGPTLGDPISPAKARRALNGICARASDGIFYEFCVALRGALKEYLKYLAKLQRRRTHSRRTR